jgi:hypothetical protein
MKIDPQLANSFHADMLTIYRRALHEYGYAAHRFRQMVVRHGGLEAARRLMRNKKVQSGFNELDRLQALGLSVEDLMLRQSYGVNLFTEDELAEATRRLADKGYANV